LKDFRVRGKKNINSIGKEGKVILKKKRCFVGEKKENSVEDSVRQ